MKNTCFISVIIKSLNSSALQKFLNISLHLDFIGVELHQQNAKEKQNTSFAEQRYI